MDWPEISYKNQDFLGFGKNRVQSFDLVFEDLALRIWNATNKIKSVPSKEEQLLHWKICKLLYKILSLS